MIITKIELSESEIKKLIVDYVNSKLGDLTVKPEEIHILVKSKQNFRSTWEECSVVATTRMTDYIPEIKVEVLAK